MRPANGQRVRIAAYPSRPELVGRAGAVRIFYATSMAGCYRALIDLDVPPTQAWDDQAVWVDSIWLEAA